ncbi:MAG TPA: hypothetical protein VGC26_08535 [Afipia sp.]
MTSYRTRTYAALIGLLTFTQGPALAQGTDQEREACTPDVFRLCGSYIPDADRIVTCLRGNADRLSQACHAVMYPQSASMQRPTRRAPERRNVPVRPADDDED